MPPPIRGGHNDSKIRSIESLDAIESSRITIAVPAPELKYTNSLIYEKSCT